MPALLAYAHVLTANPHDAEDLVMEALGKVGAAWHRVVKRDDPEGYVRRTMLHTHVSRWRSRRHEDIVAEPISVDRPSADVPIDDLITVRDALARLSPRQRATLVLRYYDGLSVHETALALGCSEGTVKSTAHDALQRLGPLIREDSQPFSTGVSND